MPVVIPQVFYDVIARVLPGYLFLVMLRAVLHGSEFDIPWFDLAGPQDPMTFLAHGISSLALCYFLGWFLRLTTIGNSETTRADRWKKDHASVKLPLPFCDMFQKIRLQNETAGFRILKLRAEARMLETSRTAMAYCFVLSLFLLYGELGGLALFTHGWEWWLAKLSVPLVLGVAFWKHEKHQWNHYLGNIVTLYRLMFPPSKSKGATPGSEGDSGTDCETAENGGQGRISSQERQEGDAQRP